MQKVVARQITIRDAFTHYFRSSISVFIPKLTPAHKEPRIMLHVSNGGGSCLIRAKDSETLVEALEEIIKTLRSDKWLDAWFRVQDVSARLIDTNELILEEELVDINEWNKALENTVDIQPMVEIKNDDGGEK